MVETCCTVHNLCELYMDRFKPEWCKCDKDVGDERSDARSALQQLFMQQQQL